MFLFKSCCLAAAYNSVFAISFAHPNAFGTSQTRETLVAMPCRKGYNTYTLGEVNEAKTDD